MAIKTRVRVNLDWDEQGNLVPKAIYWRDGSVFIVDRVLDRRKSPAMKAGGMGDRYTVRLSNEDTGVHGKNTYLFHERGEREDYWFVEERETKHCCKEINNI